MLVVIPTYKRINTLNWVVKSIDQALKKYPISNTRIRIYFVNNHPPSTEIINNFVDNINLEYSKLNLCEWKVIHRQKTLNPVLSWYSAIQELSEPDEIVFLHGDDDLLMPRGFISRIKAIDNFGADLLLSHSAHGLLFLSDGENCLDGNILNEIEKKGIQKEITLDQIDSWGPAFIGNHSYRYTEKFKEALSLSFSWCNQQDWLDENTRTLMLPYYLPFALKTIDGKLIGINETCVIRGNDLKEVINARFGVPGWNPGFLVWCAYDVLYSQRIPKTYIAKKNLQEIASKWFLTFFFDKRIPLIILFNTIQKIGLPDNFWRLKTLGFGSKILLTDILKLRRLRQRMSIFKDKKKLKDLLYSLKNV